MYSAIDEADLRFHLIHEPDGGRIGYQKICKAEEEPVPDDEIVKAFEFAKDESSSSPTRTSRRRRARA